MREHISLLNQSNILVLSYKVKPISDQDWRDLFNLLNKLEQQQADAFIFAEDRQAYIAAHALLRSTLGLILDHPPEQVQFTVGKYGKPYLQAEDNSQGLHFNLSHTRGMVAIALSIGREVGVDVENMQRRDNMHLTITDAYFASEELEMLRALPDDARRRQQFILLWTLKEAFIKASGRGLSQPLNEFAVQLDPIRIKGLAGYGPGLWHGAEWSVQQYQLAVATLWKNSGVPEFIHLDVSKLNTFKLTPKHTDF